MGRTLRFTDEERTASELQKSISKVKRAADKRGKAEAKILVKKSSSVKKRWTRLQAKRKSGKPPVQARHPLADPLLGELHRQVKKHEDENVSVQAAHEAEKSGETVLRFGEQVHHAAKLRPYREKAKAEQRLDKANLRFLQAQQEQSGLSGNPLVRLQQRRAIRREYAAAKASGFSAYRTADGAYRAVHTGARAPRRGTAFVRKGKHSLVLVGLFAMIVFVLHSVSSCMPLAQTVVNSFIIGTYPAAEEDVLAAERAYRAMELNLQDELDHYDTMHPGYDEYEYDLQDIWHDPYALIAIISAYHGGEEWTIDSAYGTLEKYFKLQYILTETVARETRYRTETQTGYKKVEDPDTGEITWVPYEYEVEVPYSYAICTVKLVNKNLSHLPVYSMSRTNMGLYALYMSTLGNMPDLFRGNPYASELKDPLPYDIPEEYLIADEKFARLIEEAEQYIGYPYVWGGSSPDTSFDCSGFISYVFTNSGVYDTGRLGATGLHGICRQITPEEARPGDLIFFEGTLGEGVDGNDGITHVGLYVGDGMMLHCGNPISYADLSRSYWQQHFYGYGRIPY